MERIVAAGNVEVPAYLTLRKAGFSVSTERVAGAVQWIARKEDLVLVGGGPLELLGLASVRNERGLDWKATDVEIVAFLKEFPAS